MPTFDNQTEYQKHLTECGCEDSSSCGCNDNDCGCCPPGLVAINDSKGNHLGCLTPNDASCYDVAKEIPVEGFMKLYDPVSNAFLGIVTISEALAYLSAVDSNIQPPNAGNDFNPITLPSASASVAGEGLTSAAAVSFSVDRISCDNAVTVSILTPPAGITFLGSATSISIPSSQSYIADGLEITDAVIVGSYDLTIQYNGCSTSKTKVITLNVV